MTVVWDNPFDPNRNICLEKCEGNTIDFIPDSKNIGFKSHILTGEKLGTLSHI